MKQILEEYGRTVIAAIAVVAALALFLIRHDLFGALGTVADVNTKISHSQSQGALVSVINRAKPMGEFSGADLHIYNNQAFRPMEGVVFTDADGEEVDAVITSILFSDLSGSEVEFLEFYNSEEDIVTLNPTHYSESHKKCTISEHTPADGGRILISEEGYSNLVGAVTVTYMATDSENQVTVAQLTFVVDSKPAKTS